MFGNNLDTWMIHWDNRAEEEAIFETFEALQLAHKEGFKVGISGIKNPTVYAKLNQSFNLDFRIQIKHNLLHSDYEKYADFHGKQRFIAYGINAGGVKLDSEQYGQNSSLKARDANWVPPSPILEKARKIIEKANENTKRFPLTTFNHLGMIYAFYHPDMAGVLLGTSRVKQLADSLDFMEAMRVQDYGDVYQLL